MNATSIFARKGKKRKKTGGEGMRGRRKEVSLSGDRGAKPHELQPVGEN